MIHKGITITALCFAVVLTWFGLTWAQCMACSSDAEHNLASGGIIGQEGTLKFDLQFTKLKPSTTYVLSINGKIDKSGNDLLIQKCGEFKKMGVCDFAEVKSDENGSLTYKGGLPLPEGEYDAKFLLKEKLDDYCAIFCYDYLRFLIKRTTLPSAD